MKKFIHGAFVTGLSALLIVALVHGYGRTTETDGSEVTHEKKIDSHKVEIKTNLPAKKVPLREGVKPVRALRVYSTGGGDTKWFKGKSQGESVKKYSFPIDGTVKDINVRDGYSFYGERLVMELDPTETKRRVEELESEVEKAELEYFMAKTEFNRLRDLYDTQQATLEEVNRAYYVAVKADKSVRKKRHELQEQRVRLEQHDLWVKIRGKVKSIDVEEGAVVKAGQTVLQVSVTMPLEITVQVPTILLMQFGEGERGKAMFEGKSAVYPVTVMNVGERTTPGPDGTFPVTVRLRHIYNYLGPNMDGKVAFRFDYRSRRSTFKVPREAVGKDEQGHFVYIVKPEKSDSPYGTLERRPVTKGKYTAEGQEVSSGLKDGEIIVVNGIWRLSPGMTVKYK